MSTSPSAKSPTSRSRLSTVPPLISFLPVGTTLKSVPAGYRSGSAASSGGSAPDDDAAGPPVVPLDQLLDVPDLEQDDPDAGPERR